MFFEHFAVVFNDFNEIVFNLKSCSVTKYSKLEKNLSITYAHAQYLSMIRYGFIDIFSVIRDNNNNVQK